MWRLHNICWNSILPTLFLKTQSCEGYHQLPLWFINGQKGANKELIYDINVLLKRLVRSIPNKWRKRGSQMSISKIGWRTKLLQECISNSPKSQKTPKLWQASFATVKISVGDLTIRKKRDRGNVSRGELEVSNHCWSGRAIPKIFYRTAISDTFIGTRSQDNLLKFKNFIKIVLFKQKFTPFDKDGSLSLGSEV